MSGSEQKQCSKCGEWKNPDQFPGARQQCRACIRQYFRGYRASHLEETRRRQRDWLNARRAADEESMKQRQRDAMRRWRAANPERARMRSRKYEHQRRLSVNAAYVEIVKVEVLAERDGDRCGICGKKVAPQDRSIDHIIPVSHPETEHSYRNTQLAHKRCNSSRKNRGPAQIRGI